MPLPYEGNLGRISGPLLATNLVRNGIDLAFHNKTESDNILYLDVTNGRIGINTVALDNELTVNGKTDTTNLIVDTQADIGRFVLNTDTIQHVTGAIYISPDQLSDPTIQGPQFGTLNLRFDDKKFENITLNSNIELTPNGTGIVKFTTSRVNVSNNLHAVGDITWDGDITFGGDDSDSVSFSSDINSSVVPDDDNTWDLGASNKFWRKLYTVNLDAANITSDTATVNGIDILLAPSNTIYVSVNGIDTNIGTHLHATFRTIKHALSVATSGTEIIIFPGTYQEQFPLTIPQGVTVKGTSIRSVIIEPTIETNTESAFLLNGETTVEFLTIQNFYSPGYGFKLAPGYLATTRSPYIYNVSVITRGSSVGSAGITSTLDNGDSTSIIDEIVDGGDSSTTVFSSIAEGGGSYLLGYNPFDPLDPLGFNDGDAGGGAFIDGSVASSASVLPPSCLFYSATFIVPNAYGIVATNKARVEWLNSFTYYANTGIRLYSGSGGFAGTGTTKVEISGLAGTVNVGDTLSYYSIDGATLIDSGIVESIDGSTYYLTDNVQDLDLLSNITLPAFLSTGATTSTSRYKFGSASLSLDGSSYINTTDRYTFNLSNNNFCIEAWVYLDAFPTTSASIIAQWGPTLAEQSFNIEVTNTGGAQVFFNDPASTVLSTGIEYLLDENGNTITDEAGNLIISENSAVITGAWQHIAIERNGDVASLYVNGSIKATTSFPTGAIINNATGQFTVGHISGGEYLTGNVDEVRFTNGTTRFAGEFTPVAIPYTADAYTAVLLHFDDANGSTTFVESTPVTQNIIFTNAIASGIVSLDYTDFGAEMRSINSANVYGTYGAVADGWATLAYLIGHNFGYIGSDGDSTNNTALVIQQNEVVENHYGVIHYDSVDQRGDFRLGDVFYVNQATGDVIFNAEAIDFSSGGSIVLESPSSTTIINSQFIETGNLKIYDNTIESLSGPVNFLANTSVTTLNTDVSVTGDLDVTANLVVDGNVWLGNDLYDTITVISNLSQDILPDDASGPYTLGLTDTRWDVLYGTTLDIDGIIQVYNNEITTLTTDTNLLLSASGTGKINITSTDVQINNNLTVSNTLTVDGITDVQDLEIDGDLTYTGNIEQISGNSYIIGTFATNNVAITGDSFFEVPNIRLYDNTISDQQLNSSITFTANGTGGVIFDNWLKITNSTISNIKTSPSNDLEKSIILVPNGTGNLEINSTKSLKLPVGNNTNRTLGASGEVRFNNTYNAIEGYSTAGLVSFYGIFDTDKNTYIIPELTPNNNDNILHFGINNIVTTTIDNSKLYNNVIHADNVSFSGNNISNVNTSDDLYLYPESAGSVVVNNVELKDDVITNTLNTAITLQSTGAGYVKFGGTGAVVIPFGGVSDRRATPELAETRYNSDDGYLEIWDGTAWIPATGSSGAATLSQIEETLNLYSLILG